MKDAEALTLNKCSSIKELLIYLEQRYGDKENLTRKTPYALAKDRLYHSWIDDSGQKWSAHRFDWYIDKPQKTWEFAKSFDKERFQEAVGMAYPDMKDAERQQLQAVLDRYEDAPPLKKTTRQRPVKKTPTPAPVVMAPCITAPDHPLYEFLYNAILRHAQQNKDNRKKKFVRGSGRELKPDMSALFDAAYQKITFSKDTTLAAFDSASRKAVKGGEFPATFPKQQFKTVIASLLDMDKEQKALWSKLMDQAQQKKPRTRLG